MDRFRIIGKTKQMTSVYLLDEEGKLKQHRILLGKQIEVDENQLTFHVHRLVGKKDIQLLNLGPVKKKKKIVEIEEEVAPVEEEEIVVEEETPAVAIVEVESEEVVAPKPKKGRGRKKKKSAE